MDAPDPIPPMLDHATIEAEDSLFDAVEPVLTEWMGARDNIAEELERRAGADWCPPGGVDRALDALRRLETAEKSARTELARLLVELGHGGDAPGRRKSWAPFPPAPKGTPDRAGSVLRGR